MVQEFYVLRCFSCQTFQVQQVKKSKKWNCKLCGEKQSLIKEYGRGTGADCRRHVQKLNSLRGELLQVQNDSVWTQWEKEEECEFEVSPEDETGSWQQKTLPNSGSYDVDCCGEEGQTEVASRWSKYVDQKGNVPESEEDEPKGKKRVGANTEESCQHNNISRKRKKSLTSRATYGHLTVDEDEYKDAAHWGTARRPSWPRRHDATFESSLQVPCSSTGFQRIDALCASPAASLSSEDISAYSDLCSQNTGANKQSFAELNTKPQPSGPLSSFFAPSFSHQQLSETKLEAEGSKWARFLPSVCVKDEDAGDTGEHAQYLDEEQTALAHRPVMAIATVLPNDTCSTSEGALLDKVCGVEKVSVFEKLKQCVDDDVCKQPTSPTITSRPVGSETPVCFQPLPIRKPAFSFCTFFQTDEDFDDEY